MRRALSITSESELSHGATNSLVSPTETRMKLFDRYHHLRVSAYIQTVCLAWVPDELSGTSLVLLVPSSSFSSDRMSAWTPCRWDPAWIWSAIDWTIEMSFWGPRYVPFVDESEGGEANWIPDSGSFSADEFRVEYWEEFWYSTTRMIAIGYAAWLTR